MLTYRKTKDGAWAVFGPAAELAPGDVTVTKRDGSTKRETVRKVSRPFDVEGVPHAYGFLGDAPPAAPTASPKCKHCGKTMLPSRYGNGHYCPDKSCRDAHARPTCAECGRPGALVADLEDGLMKHYRCCDIPPH